MKSQDTIERRQRIALMLIIVFASIGLLSALGNAVATVLSHCR